MANANVPNSIQESTPVSAPPVEQNFRYIESFLNAQVVHADGSVPFTDFPLGPSTAPTTDRQLVNKQYVDDMRGKVLWHTSRTTNSLWFGDAQTDLGSVPRGSFTVPDLGSGRGVKFSAFLPLVRLRSSGGWPTEASLIEFRLRVTNSTFTQNNGQMLLRAFSHVPPAAQLFSESTAPIYAERTVWNISDLGPPGSTVYVKSMGIIVPSGSKGEACFLGDAQRPWQIRAEIVG